MDQITSPAQPRADAPAGACSRGAAQTMLPGKAPKLQIRNGRTPNRHRWSGRGCQGAWENPGEGTRQNRAVTSGEGTPGDVKGLAPGAMRPAAVKWWLGLFNKNTALCEPGRGCIGCDTCPVPEG